MKVLITGGAGQLGQALVKSAPSHLAGEPLQLIVTGRPGSEPLTPLDLTDPVACREMVFNHRPDWLINAGAYTDVDRAEREPELAMAVNAGAPRALAAAMRQLGHGQILQVSTDFVFSGDQGHPYLPDQAPSPLGMYGASKAAGEEAVQMELKHGMAVILRTSWVYGPVGRNFMRTMLHLHEMHALSGEPLAVVADQVGCPTHSAGLAAACWQVLALSSTQGLRPTILHWSDAGAASWYDFAVAIGELAIQTGVLANAASIRPIRSVDYPTAAQRPSYSLLECTSSRQALGLEPVHWRTGLKRALKQVKAS